MLLEVEGLASCTPLSGGCPSVLKVFFPLFVGGILLCPPLKPLLINVDSTGITEYTTCFPLREQDYSPAICC